jgi:hypothetical protein
MLSSAILYCINVQVCRTEGVGSGGRGGVTGLWEMGQMILSMDRRGGKFAPLH